MKNQKSNILTREEIIRQLHEVYANTENVAVATIMANTIDFINVQKKAVN